MEGDCGSNIFEMGPVDRKLLKAKSEVKSENLNIRRLCVNAFKNNPQREYTLNSRVA